MPVCAEVVAQTSSGAKRKASSSFRTAASAGDAIFTDTSCIPRKQIQLPIDSGHAHCGHKGVASCFLLTAFLVGYRPEADQSAVILDRAGVASSRKHDHHHGSRIQSHAEVDTNISLGHLSVGFLCRLDRNPQRRGCLVMLIYQLGCALTVPIFGAHRYMGVAGYRVSFFILFVRRGWKDVVPRVHDVSG